MEKIVLGGGQEYCGSFPWLRYEPHVCCLLWPKGRVDGVIHHKAGYQTSDHLQGPVTT